MPLLGKELREQASRKGTYVARVVYAVLLFSAFLIGTWGLWGSSYNVLGRGSDMLWILVALQFCGIYLFLPAMMSRTIAEEKEKETLVLLFLTDMGPWELLLQKYLGRLIPMFCFLLLSLPLMAIAYAFGGISASMLGVSVWMVFLCCLQTGAFALMCSAYCQTPGGAFFATYIGLALFYGVPALAGMICSSLVVDYAADEVFASIAGVYFPPWLWVIAFSGNSGAGVGSSGIPVLISVVILLVGARCLLMRRVFGMPRNPMLVVFGALDRTFGRWNAKVGGVAMWKGRQTLPVDEPVAWREQQKRGIGRPHHLCRLGLLIMVPTVLIGMGMAASGGRDDDFMFLLFVGWSLAGLAMVVQGASLIAVERSRQTLEVLLTTPMAAQEIVRQKMRALWRFGVLLAVPLLTLAGIRLAQGLFSVEKMWLYMVCHLVVVLLLLTLLAWGGMWVGLRVKSRGRAIMVALVALVVWCGLPVLIAVVGGAYEDERALLGPLSLSPAAIVFMMESLMQDAGWRRLDSASIALIGSALVVGYGVLVWRLRRWCLENADQALRNERRMRQSAVGWVWGLGATVFLVFAPWCIDLPAIGFAVLNLLMSFGWPLAALHMVVKGVETIDELRSCQAQADAPVTTAIAAREIVRRKIHGLRRSAVFPAIVLLTLAVLRLRQGAFSDEWQVLFYVVGYLLAVPLILELLAWGGMWVGLRVKSLWRAIMVAALALVAWCVLPILIAIVCASVELSARSGMPVLTAMGADLPSLLGMGRLHFDVMLLSPAAVVFLLEWTPSCLGHIAGCAVVLVVGYGVMAWRVRRLCLENAERLLRGA